MSYSPDHPMTVPEIEQDVPQAGTLTPQTQSETIALEKDEKRFVSAGKRVHNEITYRGVDFLLNSTIGVAFTYWTQRTKSGQEYWAKPVGNFFKSALKPVLKSPAALEAGANWGSMFVSIIVGGTAIILPMVKLENKKNKKRIITTLNNHIHGEEKVQNDPRFAEELEAVDNEPRKNFTTGMLARGIVLTPMILATVTPAVNNRMVKYLYNPIANGSKLLCQNLGIESRALMERGATELAENGLSKERVFVSDWDFIHRTIGFDFGLTFIYCFAHEAVIKGLAAMGFKRTEEDPATPSATTDIALQPETLQAAQKWTEKTPQLAKQSSTSVPASYRDAIAHSPEGAQVEALR